MTALFYSWQGTFLALTMLSFLGAFAWGTTIVGDFLRIFCGVFLMLFILSYFFQSEIGEWYTVRRERLSLVLRAYAKRGMRRLHIK